MGLANLVLAISQFAMLQLRKNLKNKTSKLKLQPDPTDTPFDPTRGGGGILCAIWASN